MIYSEFQGKQLSLLGFGAMRLPLLPDGEIDEPLVFQMVKYAAEHGINYYDTAYPYHGAKSEIVLGKALKQLPRESFYLATKYPGHQISSTYDPAATFEEQLEKCGVDYFDFYLLHNINESSIGTYTDPKWGMVDYFVKQRELGRIKHLGFSAHGMLETIAAFLDRYPGVMEFAQIQLNYLDWTLQNAKAKYELLTRRGLPVWVMEPVRGGKLANPDENAAEKLRSLGDGSAASWAMRWLQSLPNVKMILSGMSNLEQMVDNVHTFEAHRPTTPEQEAVLFEIAEQMKNSVPCTACRYCCGECPQELDIPKLLSLYNDMRFAANFTIGMTIDGLAEDKRPAACIGCGSCSKMCPQNIDIPDAMQDFTAMLNKAPSWAEMCRRREEEARKLKESMRKSD